MANNPDPRSSRDLTPEERRARYDAVYESVPRATAMRDIWRQVYGEDYPEEADPYGFITLTALARVAHLVGVAEGDTLADLGCGRGGPGLWVARETGACLIGVDLSPVAANQARERIPDFGLGSRAAFRAADFCDTGIDDASCHGVMSIDMVWLLPDKAAAMAEVHRILRPGGRFAFTTWVPRDGSDPNYDRLLGAAGLEVVEHGEVADSDRRRRAIYEALLVHEEELLAEGASAAQPMISEAKRALSKEWRSRHALIACRKP